MDARRAQKDLGWLVTRVEADGFTVNGEPVTDDPAELSDFRDAMERAAISELRFQQAMEAEVLESFVRQLRSSGEEDAGGGPARFHGLGEGLRLSFRVGAPALPGEGVPRALTGMAGSIQDLFQAGSRDDRSAERSGGSGGVDSSPGQALSLPHGLPEGVGNEILAFLEAKGDERESVENVLRLRADRFREARDLHGLTRLVQALAQAAGRDPQRSDVLALARELTTPAVASHIVAVLGSTRDEEEQARLTNITALLGTEVTLALADALGEARDRFQRRAYLGALVALGPIGLDVAKGMVEDSRWFVVRNGVSMLGEIGGEEAVAHITTALANSDPRVRREAVLALGKLGGEDAIQLLVGMVDDPDPEVRSGACRALGALKVERGVKPLLRLLEEEEDPGVQVEVLQALGQIGDPGAVPMIEKRAVGGIFSRPSREIRIAAYRALAAIGTPHAMSLLEKAARDSDSGVRAVVEGLLS